MNIHIHKFGGAALSNAALIKNAAKIIANQNKPAVVVVSAMGKTTNALESVVKSEFFHQDNSIELLSNVKNFHSEIIHQLFDDLNSQKTSQVKNLLLPYWQYAEQLISQPVVYSYGQIYDQIVSVGELISSIIVSEYLNSIGIYNVWMDIRKILQTDNQWRAANVDIPNSEKNFEKLVLPIINEQIVIVTQGFIGGTYGEFTTTLGREGSDYTAALLANFSNSNEVTIWKDVDGVMNADPRYFKNPQKIDELSYYDAIEMTYYGATVIHPKTIKPLQNKNIPLYVKSFIHPNTSGTIIHQPTEVRKISTYSYLPKQILISLQSSDYSFFAESHIHHVFQIINEFATKVNLMQNTALNFSICTTYDDVIAPALIREFQKHFKVLYNENVAILTIRHYVPNTIQSIIQAREILLEQRTRNHLQFVIKEN